MVGINLQGFSLALNITATAMSSSGLRVQNFQCKYVGYNAFSRPTPLQAVISEAIDIDSWKHSWHYEIKPENYEKFREIIQEKMIKRAEEMDFLTTVYFQLQYEISNRSADL